MYLYIYLWFTSKLSSVVVSKANAHPASKEEKFQHNCSAPPKSHRCQDDQQVLLRTIPSHVLFLLLEVHGSFQAIISPLSSVFWSCFLSASRLTITLSFIHAIYCPLCLSAGSHIVMFQVGSYSWIERGEKGERDVITWFTFVDYLVPWTVCFLFSKCSEIFVI